MSQDNGLRLVRGERRRPTTVVSFVEPEDPFPSMLVRVPLPGEDWSLTLEGNPALLSQAWEAAKRRPRVFSALHVPAALNREPVRLTLAGSPDDLRALLKPFDVTLPDPLFQSEPSSGESAANRYT